MEKTLIRWLELGLISKEQYISLLKDTLEQKEKHAKIKTQITLYLIGAVLLGIGVILFISANDWILKLLEKCYYLQILLMSLLTFSSLFFGNKLIENRTKFPRLAHSLVFLSTILIGATYALLGQIYNIEANNAFLYLIWFISIYPLAFIFNSNAINILSCVIFAIFSFCYYLPLEGGFLSSLIPLFLGCLYYCLGNIEVIKEKFENFSLTYKTTGLVLIFISLLIYIIFYSDYKHVDKYSIHYIIFPLILIIFNTLNYSISANRAKIFKVETFYISSLLFFALLIASFGINGYIVAFLAHIFIIFKIAFLYKEGYKQENVKYITLANRFLTIYLIVNYIRIASEYLQGAFCFILGGVLLFSLGLYFEKKQKNLLKGKFDVQ